MVGTIYKKNSIIQYMSKKCLLEKEDLQSEMFIYITTKNLLKKYDITKSLNGFITSCCIGFLKNYDRSYQSRKRREREYFLTYYI